MKEIRLLHFVHNTRKTKAGFSIIEILTVLGIFSIIAMASTLMINETRKKAALQNAQASMLLALEQARNRSATGVGNTGHGVHIEEKKIITFEGDEYVEGSGDETLLPLSVSTNQSDINIVFNRLTATTTTSTIIILNHLSGATTSITITQDGIILEP